MAQTERPIRNMTQEWRDHERRVRKWTAAFIASSAVALGGIFALNQDGHEDSGTKIKPTENSRQIEPPIQQKLLSAPDLQPSEKPDLLRESKNLMPDKSFDGKNAILLGFAQGKDSLSPESWTSKPIDVKADVQYFLKVRTHSDNNPTLQPEIRFITEDQYGQIIAELDPSENHPGDSKDPNVRVFPVAFGDGVSKVAIKFSLKSTGREEGNLSYSNPYFGRP